jgi:hypothetical protein
MAVARTMSGLSGNIELKVDRAVKRLQLDVEVASPATVQVPKHHTAWHSTAHTSEYQYAVLCYAMRCYARPPKRRARPRPSSRCRARETARRCIYAMPWSPWSPWLHAMLCRGRRGCLRRGRVVRCGKLCVACIRGLMQMRLWAGSALCAGGAGVRWCVCGVGAGAQSGSGRGARARR